MDTTTGMLARTLHTLAIHGEAQKELRAEIMAAVQTSDELSYDQIMNLPFMDAVYRETLRVYVSPFNLLRYQLQLLI